MTRNTSDAVARVLAKQRREADEDREHGYGRHLALDAITYDLADLFHRNNHGFNSHLFFLAAGLRDVKVPTCDCPRDKPHVCARLFGAGQKVPA